MQLKFSSSVTLALSQVLDNHVRPVVTALDRTDREHFYRTRFS